ncbi:uncharacterized protein LOC9642270 [Selaginella moellendorffii]|uniref:uncharacterized protein LOC9642270 n=1 Tax=Selaginella moellendorffii TaxID=88036 RepID=UPI000D1CF597|nr:uncharacterized protein LOC9642270 [Selaginella moellendorffii]|eukprot:XP_024521777.1 uncharacterized protein LOC9642270 [Selaginella moellendorffii]
MSMAEEGSARKYVRLQGFHGKYLWAEDDFVTVSQDRDGTSTMASLWRVEQVGHSQRLRLKSCYDCYLTASDIPCLGGATGKKVLQTRPSKLDCAVEWELVVVDEITVKLRVEHSGNFLQANSCLPPWRSSVTHDSFCPEWSLWKVEVVDSPPSKLQVSSLPKMPPLYDGRIVFYMVAEAESEVSDASHWHYVFFRGRSPDKLAKKLRKEIDVVDDKSFAVCIRHPANSSKLYPLHLELPPGTSPIYLVVLKSSSSSSSSLRSG